VTAQHFVTLTNADCWGAASYLCHLETVSKKTNWNFPRLFIHQLQTRDLTLIFWVCKLSSRQIFTHFVRELCRVSYLSFVRRLNDDLDFDLWPFTWHRTLHTSWLNCNVGNVNFFDILLVDYRHGRYRRDHNLYMRLCNVWSLALSTTFHQAWSLGLASNELTLYLLVTS